MRGMQYGNFYNVLAAALAYAVGMHGGIHEYGGLIVRIYAIAFLVGYTGLVRRESALESLKEQFPRFIEKNMKCAEAGFRFADELLNK